MKKALFILAAVAMLTACSTHRNSTVNPMLIGTWEQPNITLDLNFAIITLPLLSSCDKEDEPAMKYLKATNWFLL